HGIIYALKTYPMPHLDEKEGESRRRPGYSRSCTVLGRQLLFSFAEELVGCPDVLELLLTPSRLGYGADNADSQDVVQCPLRYVPFS
ncbi:unnamed protein product, partial [Polarella glacialis]